MNAINILSPYKYLNMWVFDDPKVGLILVKEPFVSGADTIIDRLVADIPKRTVRRHDDLLEISISRAPDTANLASK